MRKLILTAVLAATSSLLFAQKDSAGLFLQKGIEEKQRGHRMEALNNLEKAYGYNKSDRQITGELAATYFDLRRYKQARETYKQLEQLGDQSPATLKQIMQLSFNMRQFDDAITYAQRLKKADPSEKVSYYIGKANYDRENYGDAIPHLDAAIKEDPSNAEVPYLIARAYADMMNYKLAIGYFQKALAIKPNEGRWIYEMALMYYGLHDDNNSLKYMLEAADKGLNRDNDYLENLGIAYLNVKKFDKGLEILKEALHRRPSDVNLLNMIAEALYDSKKYSEAIDYWDQMLGINKTNASALYMIGMCYQNKGEKAKGIALCDKAIEMDPSLSHHKQKLALNNGGW